MVFRLGFSSYFQTHHHQSVTHFPGLMSSKKTALHEFIDEMSSICTLNLSLVVIPPLFLSPGLPDFCLYCGCQSCRKNISSREEFMPPVHQASCREFSVIPGELRRQELIYCAWVSAWSIDKIINSQNISTVLMFWGCGNPSNDLLKGAFQRKIVFPEFPCRGL